MEDSTFLLIEDYFCLKENKNSIETFEINETWFNINNFFQSGKRRSVTFIERVTEVLEVSMNYDAVMARKSSRKGARRESIPVIIYRPSQKQVLKDYTNAKIPQTTFLTSPTSFQRVYELDYLRTL